MEQQVYKNILDQHQASLVALVTVEDIALDKRQALLAAIEPYFKRLKQTQVHSESFIEIVSDARRTTLDFCEQVFGSKPSWPLIRRRLLFIFGDRGLGGLPRMLN
ncbi:MAG: hypothetical protein IPK68_10025 [Bdellovibrionales bacterium]|nr:hypothetical protein [Bdellovibrionales bacterium]